MPARQSDGLAALATAVEELAAQDLDGLADTVQAERVLELRRLLDRLEGHWLKAPAAVDAAGAAGQLSVAHAGVLAHGPHDLPPTSALPVPGGDRPRPTWTRGALVEPDQPGDRDREALGRSRGGYHLSLRRSLRRRGHPGGDPAQDRPATPAKLWQGRLTAAQPPAASGQPAQGLASGGDPVGAARGVLPGNGHHRCDRAAVAGVSMPARPS